MRIVAVSLRIASHRLVERAEALPGLDHGERRGRLLGKAGAGGKRGGEKDDRAHGRTLAITSRL